MGAIHYCGDISLAFYSVNHISRMLIMDDCYEYFMLMVQDFFYLPLFTRRSRFILWFLFFHTYLDNWSSNSFSCNSYSILRLCASLRPNIILRGHGYYKSFFRNSLYWWRFGSMNMGRVCSR